MDLGAFTTNLASPVVLFFILGIVATIIRSDLVFPDAFGKAIAVYLLIGIGFKGGVGLNEAGVSVSLVLAIVAAMALALLTPLIAFALLRRTTALNGLDAATVAAHYGSASLVTFLAATNFLALRGPSAEPYLVTLLAVMESPAIVIGMLMARRSSLAVPRQGHGLREAITNGSVVLLLGATVIGALTGQNGLTELDGLLVSPFQGILALFLLDMGLLAGRRFRDFRRLGPGLVAFAIVMPLIGAALGLAAGSVLGLSIAGVTLLATLAASASYIVAPAAFRHAYPEADTPLAVTLALGLTFPFNLVVGIPLYWSVAIALAG
jgi:uncharacterized protein